MPRRDPGDPELLGRRRLSVRIFSADILSPFYIESNRMSFTPGQRWHSLTEPELGLGRVDAVEGRQVVIAYPARDVIRRYSTDDPPLARVRLTPGQQIRGAGLDF